MDNDYGILVSQPSQSANGSTSEQALMSTKYPFSKIDVTNPNSFKTFQINFVNDPPEPTLGSSTTTLIYFYSHGYNYLPQFWMLAYMSSVTADISSGKYQTYLLGSGIISSFGDFSGAIFYATADDTNIYFYVEKYNSSGYTNNLAGLVLDVTVFVFADEIGTL